MSVEGLPLKLGERGDIVRDLHQRLAQADFPVTGGGDAFTPETQRAVEAFQESRGLERDGECGRQTWAALAEAAHRLGDRLLYLQSPMLRGDDVAALQRRLGALGFDAGRVDGIFGPDTVAALEGFQRNAGLPTDAIFGPDSHAALNRLGGREDRRIVTSVRERERLRANLAELGGCRLVLGEPGGLGAVLDTVARHIRSRGLRVETVTHPEGSHHALVANQLDADVYLGVRTDEQPRCAISYFATTGFSSAGGSHLAALLAEAFTPLLDQPVEVVGRRLPVLRETRMPAVVVRIGPTDTLVQSAVKLADVAADAIVRWFAEPIPSGDDDPS